MSAARDANPKTRKKWGRGPKITLGIIGALLAGFIVIGITTGGTAAPSDTETPAATAPESPTAEQPATEPPAAETPAVEEKPAEPQLTASQAQAKASAAQYLRSMPFSRTGLISQLEYGGFSTADATVGVDAQNADWNAQAVAKAKQYLDTAPFSHSALVDQLVFEGFTAEQAEHGATGAGL